MSQSSGNRRSAFNARVLTFGAVCLAIATALGFVPVIEMPQGGSIGIFRMFFVSLPGYFFGPAVGFASAVAYGLLDFAIKPFFYHPAQFLLDYVLGFGALGVSGFFKNRKYGLYNGFVLGAEGRFLFSVLSGVVFFAEYAGDQNVWVYSIGYQASYILPETVITILLLAIPAVQDGIDRVKRMFAM